MSSRKTRERRHQYTICSQIGIKLAVGGQVWRLPQSQSVFDISGGEAGSDPSHPHEYISAHLPRFSEIRILDFAVNAKVVLFSVLPTTRSCYIMVTDCILLCSLNYLHLINSSLIFMFTGGKSIMQVFALSCMRRNSPSRL